LLVEKGTSMETRFYTHWIEWFDYENGTLQISLLIQYEENVRKDISVD
jgi:hypothetical protein